MIYIPTPALPQSSFSKVTLSNPVGLLETNRFGSPWGSSNIRHLPRHPLLFRHKPPRRHRPFFACSTKKSNSKRFPRRLLTERDRVRFFVKALRAPLYLGSRLPAFILFLRGNLADCQSNRLLQLGSRRAGLAYDTMVSTVVLAVAAITVWFIYRYVSALRHNIKLAQGTGIPYIVLRTVPLFSTSSPLS